MKKVLIITYYWPPSGGSGVQRWLKFVKYLQSYGWEPIVYTVSNGEYPVLDESLNKEIPEGITLLKEPIWEPYQLYKRFTGQKKDKRVVSAFLTDKKPGLTSRISTWIRGNLFIPDARMFWIRHSISYLRKYLKDNPVDAIASTGPPHTCHMIGLGVHKKTNIPWLADFRDPWTKIDFYRHLMLSKWADRRHHRMEKEVVSTASKVAVISPNMKKDYEALSGREIDLITNGYDGADLSHDKHLPHLDEKFSIVHIGLLNIDRDHDIFWQALSELVAENKELAESLLLRFVGKVDVSAHESMEKYKMKDYVELIDYMPHTEVTALQATSQILYLSINNTHGAEGIVTGKIFEYMASGRPILCVGPQQGDAALIVKAANAGKVADFSEKDLLKEHILYFFAQYQRGTLKAESHNIEKYSRKALTGTLAQLLDAITS